MAHQPWPISHCLMEKSVQRMRDWGCRAFCFALNRQCYGECDCAKYLLLLSIFACLNASYNSSKPIAAIAQLRLVILRRWPVDAPGLKTHWWWPWTLAHRRRSEVRSLWTPQNLNGPLTSNLGPSAYAARLPRCPSVEVSKSTGVVDPQRKHRRGWPGTLGLKLLIPAT
jgi:hypothetical protein